MRVSPISLKTYFNNSLNPVVLIVSFLDSIFIKKKHFILLVKRDILLAKNLFIIKYRKCVEKRNSFF